MPSKLAGITILVVEDDRDAREALVYVLEDAGAQVYAVDNAPDARAIFKALPITVLVSDIAMPDEDGYSLVRSIRALAPDPRSRVHAIALTAFGRAEDRAHALAAGFDLHLVKPTLPLGLIEAIVRECMPVADPED